MVNIDWKRLKNVDLDDVQDDELDDFYSQLIHITVDDEKELEKLQIMLKLSQVIMKAKSLQAEVAMEELDKMAESQGTTSGKTVQRLMQENEDLKQQIQHFEKFGRDREISKSKQGENGDLRRLHDEIRHFRREIEKLHLELQTAKRNLEQEKAQTEKYLSRLEEAERERRGDRQEIDNLRDEIQDYRHRLESETDSILNRSQIASRSNKIRDKNQQINKLLEEIEILEKSNHEFQSSSVEFRSKLEDATKQMEITTAEYLRLKTALSNSENVMEDLQRENSDLRSNFEEIVEINREKEENEEKIVHVFNEKIDGWKIMVANRDKEIEESRRRIKELEEQINANLSGGDGNSMNIFSKTLEDRDKRVQLLTQQLSKATSDYQQTTKLIENLILPQTQHGDGNLEAKYQNQINIFQSTIKQKDEIIAKTHQILAETEIHASNKDKDLIAALIRLREYEAGEYGLPEAVNEIKDLKIQLRRRDEKVEDLTKDVNKKDVQVGELLDENEELRTRLGLDPLDPELIKKEGINRRWSERVLNEKLRDEVEKLEEERVEMKMEIRRLAQAAGLRSSVGGSIDGLNWIKEDCERIREKSDVGEKENVKLLSEQIIKHKEELSHLMDQLQISLQENSKFRQLVKQSNEDVEHLENGLKEVLDALQKQNGISDVGLKCPSLEKLILLIESKRLTGSYDRAVFAKSQLDLERGKNEELRQELRRFKYDFVEEIKTGQPKKMAEIEKMSPRMITSFFLPDNLTMSSSSTIAILNTQLVEILDAFEEKSTECEEMEKVVEKCREQFDVIWSERSLIYEEFEKKKSSWNDEKIKASEEGIRMLERNDELKITAEEFKKMKEILSSDGNEIRRRVAELSGNLIISKTNEKICRRKCVILSENEKELKKRIGYLEDELMDLSMSNDDRVMFLEEFKENVTLKITQIQRELDNSIPKSTFQKLEHQFDDLTSKYHDVLQQVAEFDIPISDNIDNELSSTESSKLQPHSDKSPPLIETQLINERRRAENAESLLKHEREMVKKILHQNQGLEQRLQEMTEKYFDQTSTDNEDKNQTISKLEGSMVKLKIECEQWKKVSEIARNQVESFRVRLDRRKNDSTSLQQRVLVLEASGDEKMEIGKQHRILLGIKNELVEKKSSLQKYQLKLRDIDARNLRLEKRCTEYEENSFKIRNENRAQVQSLQLALQTARQKLVGGASLKNQEEMGKIILQLKKDQVMIKSSCKKISKDKIEAEEKFLEANLVLRNVQEMARTIKDGDSALRLIQWSDEIRRVGLDIMKVNRENRRFKDKINYQNNLLSKYEAEITKLELEITQSSDENEKRQLKFYQQERRHQFSLKKSDELEKTDRKSKEIEKSDRKSETILILQAENQNLCRKLSKLEQKIQDNIETISSRDEIISKLKTSRISKPELEFLSRDEGDDFRRGLELRHGLDILQSHVETLQARLLQKEEAIARYCTLLQEARDGLVESEKHHQMTLQTLQSKLHYKTDLTLEKFKEIVRQASEKSQNPPELVRSQSIQIQKLDDTVAEQDIALRNLADKLKDTQQQNEIAKKEVELVNKEHLKEIERLTQEYKKNVGDLSEELLEAKTTSQSFKSDVEKLEEEIRIQKAENSAAPPVILQKSVEKLKEEVHLKDKQLQSLSKTLTDLKAQMVALSEERTILSEAIPPTETQNQLISDLEHWGSQLEKQNSRLRRDKTIVDAELQELKREKAKSSRSGEDSCLKSRDSRTRTSDDEKVIRWEEKKKWQKVIEKLKDEVKKEKTTVEELEKRIKLQRNVIARMENEKKFLVKRIKSETEKRNFALTKIKVDGETELQEQLLYVNNENAILRERIIEVEEILNKPKNEGDNSVIDYPKIINRLNADIEKLKLELIDMEKNQLVDSERIKSFRKASEKLLGENSKVFKELQQEQTINKNLRQKEVEMKNKIRILENQHQECEEKLNSVQSKISANSNHYQLFLEKKNLHLKIEDLEKDLRIKSRLLDEITQLINKSLRKGENLKLLVSRLSQKIQERQI